MGVLEYPDAPPDNYIHALILYYVRFYGTHFLFNDLYIIGNSLKLDKTITRTEIPGPVYQIMLRYSTIGGPVAVVTWTLNGRTIVANDTFQTSQVVIDFELAIYEITLNVTDTGGVVVTGTYTSTAKGPSQSSNIVTISLVVKYGEAVIIRVKECRMFSFAVIFLVSELCFENGSCNGTCKDGLCIGE